MNDHISDYDPAEALETEEAIAVFIDDALESGDADYIDQAIRVAARAQGMINVKKGSAP